MVGERSVACWLKVGFPPSISLHLCGSLVTTMPHRITGILGYPVRSCKVDHPSPLTGCYAAVVWAIAYVWGHWVHSLASCVPAVHTGRVVFGLSPLYTRRADRSSKILPTFREYSTIWVGDLGTRLPPSAQKWSFGTIVTA